MGYAKESRLESAQRAIRQHEMREALRHADPVGQIAGTEVTQLQAQR